jgi:hypothetical protein
VPAVVPHLGFPAIWLVAQLEHAWQTPGPNATKVWPTTGWDQVASLGNALAHTGVSVLSARALAQESLITGIAARAVDLAAVVAADWRENTLLEGPRLQFCVVACELVCRAGEVKAHGAINALVVVAALFQRAAAPIARILIPEVLQQAHCL